MKVKIIYDKNQIKKELLFIEKNIQHFITYKMYFYFPFESVAAKDDLVIKKQIEKDEEKFKMKIIKDRIVDEWTKKEKIIIKFLLT